MSINDFKKHLDASATDIINNGYDEKHNVTISCNGKEIVLDLHADLYNNLLSLLAEEMEE